MALCIEAGKPIQDARGEVGAADRHLPHRGRGVGAHHGEVLPLDISPRARDYTGMWKRVPIGPCSFISPFNFPLNLAAHKVAPAIAAGCPFVLEAREPHARRRADHRRGARRDRAAGAAPSRSCPCRASGADRFTTDERLKLLSLHRLAGGRLGAQGAAGKKKVVLELGGNAAVIVDRDADLDDATAADRLRRLLPVRTELHRRAAHPGRTRTSTTSCASGW